MRMKTFVALRTPHPEDQESYGNVIKHRRPLCSEESTFLECEEDLLFLADGREIGWLDGFCKTSTQLSVRHSM